MIKTQCVNSRDFIRNQKHLRTEWSRKDLYYGCAGKMKCLSTICDTVNKGSHDTEKILLE